MTDPAKACCGNCRFCGATVPGLLECRAHPPAVIGCAIPAPPVIGGGPPQIQWLVKAVWPPVRETQTCGEFQPKAEIVN